MTNKNTNKISTRREGKLSRSIMAIRQFTMKMWLLMTIIGIFFGAIVIFQGTNDIKMVLPMAPAVAWGLTVLVSKFIK